MPARLSSLPPRLPSLAPRLPSRLGSLGSAGGVHSSSPSRAFSSSPPSRGGALYICGTGEYNKLGLGDTKDREVPVPVEALADETITHVSCGKYHTAALSEGGEVFAWGLESSGQLGLGSKRTKAPTPQKLEALSGKGVSTLSCGLYHTLALTEQGEVYSVGYGGSFLGGAGALGHGDRTQLETPRQLSVFGSTAPRAVSISAGGFHSIVQDEEGGVWSFGRGEWGRLGHSDSSDLLEPKLIDECQHMGGVATALAAEGHSACLSDEGKVFTWGRNEHFQLGYEVVGLLNSGQSFDAQQDPAPVQMPEEAGGAKAVKLAIGEMGCVALLEDETLWMWGMARYFAPTQLKVLQGRVGSKIVDIQMGATHLAILTEDANLFTFGTGTPLCLPKKERKSWELSHVPSLHLDERRVLQVACGSYSTALILEK